MRELHRAIARRIAVEKPRLSGAEFRFLRKELSLSQVALAKWLELDEQTVSLWERGRFRIPVAPDRVLRQLVLEQYGGNARLKDLIERLAAQVDATLSTKRIFENRPRKGWVLAA